MKIRIMSEFMVVTFTYLSLSPSYVYEIIANI